MARIATFDEWVDIFRQWQKDIGCDRKLLGDYQFEAKFGALKTAETEFGDYAGGRKWETHLQLKRCPEA